mgnify:CR=1 FL=1
MNIKILQKLKIPKSPGVYFFLKGKEIIYIGKATSLKNRVKSYFGKDLITTRGPLLVDMVFSADKLEWQKTDNVLEALILEAEFIKKNQPKYNTKEKDDKSFNYIVITKEELPKVIIVRGKNLSEEEKNSLNTFGPYTNGSQLREAVKIIRRIFPFLDEKSKNYAEFYRQLNLVPNLKDHELYLQNIKNIKLFLRGKKKEIFRNLKKEMKTYALRHEFEKAGEIKRQVFSLQHINDVALLKNEVSIQKNSSTFLHPASGTFRKNNFSVSTLRIEAYDIAHMGGKNMVGVMTVVENGQAVKSEYKKFKIRTQGDANDTGALAEVLSRRLNHPEWTFPDLIVVDGGVAQINTAHKVLRALKIKIPVVSVVKDERHKPKAIQGSEVLAREYKSAIVLANSEAHRFAINYHKNMRNRNFLK